MPVLLCEVFLDKGAFTPLNGASPFDVLNEQLIPVPLGHCFFTFEAIQFRLLLVIHPMKRQSLHTLAGLIKTLNKLSCGDAELAGVWLGG